MLTGFLFSAMAALPAPQIIVTRVKAGYELKLDGGTAFRTASKPITSARTERLNDGTIIGFYKEGTQPRYVISQDGRTVLRDVDADYTLQLKVDSFDPLKRVPVSDLTVPSNPENDVYVIQFVTQPLDEYRTQLEAAGVKLYDYFTNHAFIAQIPAESKAAVSALPFIRWVGAYEASWRLDRDLMRQLQAGTLGTKVYNIWCHVRGTGMQGSLAQTIENLGGTVNETIPQGFRVTATLTPVQLKQVLAQNEVQFVDEWSAPAPDMDNVRAYGGANFIQTTLGYTGTGVRAEVMDGGLLQTHTAWGSAPLVHAGTMPVDSHGTATFGINFGNGNGNAAGRGMLPNAQGVMANYNSMSGGNRYTHTQQLLASPYFCVYQSNSWGNAQVTTYTSISAEMDDILMQNDITILNSQSNTGSQLSRPQAWAKNVVSIGAFNHFNNQSDTDDRWQSGASIGPAADGRVKPELAFWYDSILCPTSTNTTAYTSSFGGTSAATPMTAGHFGLFFQMWHTGQFLVPVPAATVFDNRPKATLAKAIMINTARQRTLPAPFDITRNVQGWGVPNLQDLYNARTSMITVNETVPLNTLQTATFKMSVASGQPALKVTMVYTDPPGTVGAGVARKNNLSLKITGPSGTIWWGNSGMSNSNWTASGGTENNVDTVENVYIQNPAAGTYTVQVIGSDINTDARAETPGVNADFALVATGVQNGPLAASSFAVLDGGLTAGNLASLGISDNDRVRAARGITSTKSTFLSTVDMTFTTPLTTYGQGTIVLERSSSISGINERIQFFNNNTNNWDSSPVSTVPTADGVREYSIAAMGPYVNASKQIKARLIYDKADPLMPKTATVDIDFARMNIEP